MADSRTLQILIEAKNNATKELGVLGKQLESMQPTFQKMALIGGATFGALSLGVSKAVKEASDLEESVNAVNVVFGEGAKTVLDFGKNANTAVGMTTSAFNQMSTQTGALLKDTGLSMDDVAKNTIMLTKRASDMASVFNTDVDDAMSAINQALRGETEAIRRYAGNVTDATLQTYLLSKGIQTSTTDLTENEKRLLRMEVIMQQTAVTSGDFANTSDSLSNRQRILDATLTNVSATLGTTFIPIIQDVLNKVSPIIQKVSEWIQANPELARNIILVTGAIAGLVAIAGTLGLLIPTIVTGFGMLISPVGAVVVAITAVIGAITYLWTTNEEFRDKITEIWNSIQEIAMTVFNGLASFWREWGDEITLIMNFVFTEVAIIFSTALTLISESLKIILAIMKGDWNGVFESIKTITQTVTSSIFSIIEEFGKMVIGIFTPMVVNITDIWTNLWNGLRNITQTMTNALKPIISGFTSWFEDKFNTINSFIGSIRSGVESVSGAIGGAVQSAGNILGTRATGGPINQTGIYKLHEGEYVVPKNQQTSGQNIVVNINGGTYLSEDVAEEMGDKIITRLKTQLAL
jgi:hypothetical protein